MKVAVVLSFLMIQVSQCGRVTRQFVPGGRCTTPLGDTGDCRNIKNCQVLLDVAKLGDSSAATLLRNSRCGPNTKEAFVCCPHLSSNSYGPIPDGSIIYESGQDRPTTQRYPTSGQSNPETTNFLNSNDESRDPPRRTTSKPVRGQSDRLPPRINSNSSSSSSSKCGKSSGSTDRIVGGDSAVLGAWPWISALGYTSTSRGGLQWLCGGALVTDRHVITAAHCVVSTGDKTLRRVRLGDLDLEDDIDDGARPVDMDVDSVVPHSEYKPNGQVNDIAVVKMKGRVDFNDFIQPICLPDAARLGSLVGKAPYVAGWGALLFRGPSSTVLQQVDVPVASEESCRNSYRNQVKAIIDERVICAGTGGKDACQGDSGGPLMYEQGNLYYLVGVVSYGKDCATPGYPGVYTRVSTFTDWINRNLN